MGSYDGCSEVASSSPTGDPAGVVLPPTCNRGRLIEGAEVKRSGVTVTDRETGAVMWLVARRWHGR